MLKKEDYIIFEKLLGGNEKYCQLKSELSSRPGCIRIAINCTTSTLPNRTRLANLAVCPLSTLENDRNQAVINWHSMRSHSS